MGGLSENGWARLARGVDRFGVRVALTVGWLAISFLFVPAAVTFVVAGPPVAVVLGAGGLIGLVGGFTRLSLRAPELAHRRRLLTATCTALAIGIVTVLVVLAEFPGGAVWAALLLATAAIGVLLLLASVAAWQADDRRP